MHTGYGMRCSYAKEWALLLNKVQEFWYHSLYWNISYKYVWQILVKYKLNWKRQHCYWKRWFLPTNRVQSTRWLVKIHNRQKVSPKINESDPCTVVLGVNTCFAVSISTERRGFETRSQLFLLKRTTMTREKEETNLETDEEKARPQTNDHWRVDRARSEH